MFESTRPLETVVEQMRGAIDQSRSVRETVGKVKDVLAKALTHTGWLPDRCRQASADCYARHLIYSDPQERFIMVAMVWSPGQKTPIHDHGGIWCVEGVYEGHICVRRYQVEETAGSDVAQVRELEVLDSCVGSTGMLIPPVEHHVMENDQDTLAITVHAYGHEIQECHVFLPRPDGAYDVRVKPLNYMSLPAGSEIGAPLRG